MDNIAPRDRDFEVDLESGVEVSVEDSSIDPDSGVKVQAKSLLTKVWGVFVDGTTKGEEGVNLCIDVPNSDGVSEEQVKVERENTVDHVEKKLVKEKRKKTSNKKAPKPPRPPRGPSLDAADQKLIKEISELAKLKRARIERMKALKIMKAAKASSNSNLFAMLFTVLFCLVIIFQGKASVFFTLPLLVIIMISSCYCVSP